MPLSNQSRVPGIQPMILPTPQLLLWNSPEAVPSTEASHLAEVKELPVGAASPRALVQFLRKKSASQVSKRSNPDSPILLEYLKK